MGRKQPKTKKVQHRVTDNKLAAGLQKTLDVKYARILEAAKRKWEREFGPAKNPSDASASVRISGAKSGSPASARKKSQQ